MPANRTEALQPQAEAVAAETAAPVSRPGFEFKAWLPLLVTILVMPVLAYAMTAWVLVPRVQRGLGIAPASAESSAGTASNPGAKPVTVPLDKLLVNVAGTMGSRYVLVSLSVAGVGSDFQQKMQDNDAALRDRACGILATKTLPDLGQPDARNVIRNELLTAFNNILGNNCVKEIYLTEFAIQ